MTRFVIEHSPYQRNEEPVIHVAKKWLEFVTGGKASNQEYPDKIKGLQSEVETTFFIDNTKYALEHTCIEAFSGELRSDSFWNSQFGLKIKELEKELNNFLPASLDLELTLPNNMEIPAKYHQQFMISIQEWILSQSTFLREYFPDNISIKIIKVENHEIKLRLARHRLRYTDKFSASRISFIRIAKSDEAYDRRIIVEKAFLSKAKKLSAHKEKGAKSVLVLEWRYRIPTPYSPIIYAHKILKESYSNAIDMVILVGIDNKEWAIKYTESDLKIPEKELMNNWWLYNWEEDRIRNYAWS